MGLLDECASRCKHTNLMELHPLDRHQRILNALERSKLFKKFFVKITGMRGRSLVRGFEMESCGDGVLRDGNDCMGG